MFTYCQREGSIKKQKTRPTVNIRGRVFLYQFCGSYHSNKRVISSRAKVGSGCLPFGPTNQQPCSAGCTRPITLARMPTCCKASTIFGVNCGSAAMSRNPTTGLPSGAASRRWLGRPHDALVGSPPRYLLFLIETESASCFLAMPRFLRLGSLVSSITKRNA
jgi:hypothetical protein